MENINIASITDELKIDAHGLGIPDGAAEQFINRTIKSLRKSLSQKSLITEKDLNRLIVKELKKYNADFAYIYQNRDTII